MQKQRYYYSAIFFVKDWPYKTKSNKHGTTKNLRKNHRETQGIDKLIKWQF